MSYKKVLITGGTGFIGANIVRRLLKDGHDVHLLVRKEYDNARLDEVSDNLHFYEVDLTELSSLDTVLMFLKPDWVFHLSVYGAYSHQNDGRSIFETNVIGTMNLINACTKCGFEVFVNTGSSSEYGYKGHPSKETELLEPASTYAVSKAATTMFCGHIAREKNVMIPTLRLFSVYGPYEDDGRLVPTLIRYGTQGQLPPLVDPDIAHDFVFVDDVVDAYLLAAMSQEQQCDAIYNVGTGVQTSIRDIVDVARRQMNILVEPQWGTMPNRQWDTSCWIADNRLIRKQLGWTPNHSLEEGFQKTLSWFRSRR